MAQNSISHLDGRRFVAAPGKEERTFGIHSLYNFNDAVAFFFSSLRIFLQIKPRIFKERLHYLCLSAPREYDCLLPVAFTRT
jgi:hypothetical protein